MLKKSLLILIILLIFMSFNSVLAQTSDEWYSKGEAYYKEGNFKKALECYNEAIRLFPENVDAIYKKGMAIYKSGGTLEDELKCYDKVLEIYPFYHKAWYARGGNLHEQGKIKEARCSYYFARYLSPESNYSWYSYNTSSTPASAAEWYEMSVIFGKLNDNRAINGQLYFLDKTLNVNPDYIDALVDKAGCLNFIGEFKKSLKYSEKAINLKPFYRDVWRHKGYALSRLGKYQEAIWAFDEALKINPDDSLSEYQREEARKALERENL